jgi:hypothetical protein
VPVLYDAEFIAVKYGTRDLLDQNVGNVERAGVVEQYVTLGIGALDEALSRKVLLLQNGEDL